MARLASTQIIFLGRAGSLRQKSGPKACKNSSSEFRQVGWMNIKGVLNNIFPIDAIRKTNDRKASQASPDRDPNQGAGEGPKREPHLLSEQELEEVLKYLNGLPGIKEHSLSLHVERKEKRIVIFVKDMTGKVIRRIPDTELWELLKAKQSPSRGNLLNKAL